MNLRVFVTNCRLADSFSSVVHETSLLHAPMTLTPFQCDTCGHPSMCKGPDRQQRLLSTGRAVLVLSFPCWILCLLQVILALIPIPHVVSRAKTHLRLHLQCTSKTSLLVVVGHVYVVGRAVGGLGKSDPWGVPPMTKQHFRNFSNGRSSDESRYGGADATLDTKRASFTGYLTASRGFAGAAAPLVDTRTIGKAPTFTGKHKDWPELSFQFTAYKGVCERQVDGNTTLGSNGGEPELSHSGENTRASRSTTLSCTLPRQCAKKAPRSK